MCTLKHTILLLAMALLILGCEREGIVKIDDCQEVVQLETQKGSRPFAYLFTTFTCMYDKTTDKRSIIGGLCLARENAVFHSGCVKAAVYKRESDIHCPPYAHANADGTCSCDGGYPLYEVHYQYESNTVKQYTNCTATAANTAPPAPPAPDPQTLCRYEGPKGRRYLTNCPGVPSARPGR